MVSLLTALVAPIPASAQRTPRAEADDAEEPSDKDSPQGAPGADRERLKLKLNVGEQKVLSADGVRSFSEGTRGVVEIRLTKDNERFVVVGLRAGQTTVLLLMVDGGVKQYDVTVEDPNAPVKAPPLTGIQPRDNIRLDFYFVQMSNTDNFTIGVDWGQGLSIGGELSMGYNFTSGVSTGPTAAIFYNALPKLDFAQSTGWAKLVRKAAVITANEGNASVSGGGEFNVAVAGGFGGAIKSIAYGTNISVRPRYDKNTGRIELQVTADVSDLTPDGGVGAPGRSTAALDTIVNLQLGQSLVLGGLSTQSINRGKAGVIGLSQIPILGALFGQHTALNAESQMAVFIVPSVIDTVSLQQRGIITEALQNYEAFEGDLATVGALVPSQPDSRPR